MEAGWRDRNCGRQLQPLNPQPQRPEGILSRMPVTNEDVIQKVGKLAPCLQGQTVLSCHVARPIAEVSHQLLVFVGNHGRSPDGKGYLRRVPDSPDLWRCRAACVATARTADRHCWELHRKGGVTPRPPLCRTAAIYVA